MRVWVPVFVLVMAAITDSSRVLSRTKRYLVFPEGSALVMTISSPKRLPMKQPRLWNVLIECDVAFKLPNSTRKPEQARQKPKMPTRRYQGTRPYQDTRPHYYARPYEYTRRHQYGSSYQHKYASPYQWHRRDRRELYQQLETLMATQGLDGRACIQRAVCETQEELRSSSEGSFLLDILKVLFTIPSGDEDGPSSEMAEFEAAAGRTPCGAYSAACPFSLLHFEMPWE